MTNDLFAAAAALNDRDLLTHIHTLARRERLAACELIAHLAELDTRQVLIAEGHTLFTYCTRRLGFSEDAAYTRVEVAGAARRFPMILDGLADGSLTLTAVRMLGRHLTADNVEDVLARARRRSKREVEVLVAHLSPRPEIPATVRKLPAPVEVQPKPPSADVPAPEPFTAAVLRPPAPPPVVRPVAPERFRIQVTVGPEAHDALRRLQDLLRREIPTGDPAAIVERALALLLHDVERRKLAATSKPRATRSGTGTPPRPAGRSIPAGVRRAVWRRDGGRCAFVSASGDRCPERALLEIHHRHPYALGGPATLENLSLRCRRHNAYESELVFGARSGTTAAGAVATVRRSPAAGPAPRPG
jgi:hypothetical protein